MVTILFTDNSAYWGDAMVTAVPSSTTFQYAHSGSDIASQATPGVVALAYVAILDNGMNTHLTTSPMTRWATKGTSIIFSISGTMRAPPSSTSTTMPFAEPRRKLDGIVCLFGRKQGRNQIAPVITLRDSTITANAPTA